MKWKAVEALWSEYQETERKKNAAWDKKHQKSSLCRRHVLMTKHEFIQDLETKGLEPFNPYDAAYDERQKAQRAHAGRRFRGVVYLNAIFKGCDRHHKNERQVMCIPKELHESVRHNLRTGQGMDKINALADEWLAQQVLA